MPYVFAPPPVVSLPVAGSSDLVPIRRINCVGRNYAEHVREMGADPDREPPFFFAKPADALVPLGGTVPYPPATRDLHHEIELVVVIGKAGRDIAESAALDHVWGYGVGIDLTRRDLQAEAKKHGRPWAMAKGFDHSAPCSAIQPASRIGHPAKGAIQLKVNGTLRQCGDLAQQIWNVPEMIACLSRLVDLAPGDLVFTGTPAGVGAVVAGDVLEGRIEGIGEIAITLVPR